jgi:hypothetical protein
MISEPLAKTKIQGNWGTMKADPKKSAYRQSTSPELAQKRRDIEAKKELMAIDKQYNDYAEITIHEPWINDLGYRKANGGY